MSTLATRLARRTKRGEPNDCWLWQGPPGTKGYGQIRGDGGKRSKLRGVHQVAWELSRGRVIPSGMLVEHDCDVRLCVNPRHLRLGTNATNMKHAVLRGRIQTVITPRMLEEGKRLRSEGWSFEDIANLNGVQIMTLWNALSEAGRSWKHLATPKVPRVRAFTVRGGE